MGTRTENLLLETAEDKGYAGIRVDFGTGYGFHNPHDAGDIIVGHPIDVYAEADVILSNLYVIEEKYRANDTSKYIQVDPEKFDAMIRFAEAIGATPLLAVRWSSELDWSPGAEHYICDARDVERTDNGGINIKPADVEKESYESAESFFG